MLQGFSNEDLAEFAAMEAEEMEKFQAIYPKGNPTPGDVEKVTRDAKGRVK
jgi:hypothetical protein